MIRNYQSKILGEVIGKGAFGTVFKVFNTETGETHAIKQIKISNMTNSDLEDIMVYYSTKRISVHTF